jgi:hypothetical protein
MLLVALTRFSPQSSDLEAEVAALAPVFGIGAYELRLALAQPPPIVLASAELERAKEHVLFLRGRGHGAVACEAASVLSSDTLATPREFRFEPVSLIVEAPSFGRANIRYSDILLICEATHAREEEKSEERTEKKLSLTRSVLSGGLINTKSKTTSSRQSTEERERVLYVINASGSGHVLFREHRLRYTGLGASLGRTVGENFATLRRLLVEHAPGALFDDRLAKNRRSAGAVQVTGTTQSKSVTTSNAGATDVAVHLLAVAHRQRQI